MAAVGRTGLLVGRPTGRPGRAAVRPRRPVQLHLSAVRRVAVPARCGRPGRLAGRRHHRREHRRADRAVLAGAGRGRCPAAARDRVRGCRTCPADLAGGLHAAPGRDRPDRGRAGRGRPAGPTGRQPVAGDRHRAGRRDQAHPADLRGLPAADPPRPGRRHRRRGLRRHDRGGPGAAARPVPRLLAGRGVRQPEPGRQPGQSVRPVAVRGARPARRKSGRGQGLVARGGAADRAGRDRGRRVGAPARPPAGRRGVLRRHRPARLAVLLDPPLGLGRPAADRPGHDGVAAPLPYLGPGRGRGRRRVLRFRPAARARRPPSPVLLLAGDLYVLCGLALLAGTALVLARESAVGRPSRTGPDHAGLPWRSWPSLIGWTMAWSPEVRLPSHQTRRQP